MRLQAMRDPVWCNKAAETRCANRRGELFVNLTMPSRRPLEAEKR